MSLDRRLIPMEFRPPRGLRGCHVQSVVCKLPWRSRAVRSRAAALLAAGEPEVVDCGDGVRLLGFYSRPPSESLGLVVLLHGWEGCADSSYMLSAGTRLFEAGFEVFRLNFRDHGATQALNEDLFHSCRIAEVVGAVKAIHELHAARRLFVVGQSLGGNFALRVGAHAPQAGVALDGVVAVCPVLDPRSTMLALEQGLWVYRSYFLRRWRRSLRAKAAAFPNRYDFGDLERFRTLTETTDFFVRRYTEYPDLESYLQGYAITGKALQGLAIRATLIAAEDDPVNPSRDIERIAKSEALRVTLMPAGGHCGFVDSWGLRSWIDGWIVNELESSIRDASLRT